MKGQKVCRVHGGRSPQAQAKAAERLAGAEVADQISKRLMKKDFPTIDSFYDEFEQQIAMAIWWRDICLERVEKLNDDEWRYKGQTGEQVRAEVQLFTQSMERVGKFLESGAKLNLAERKQKLDEAQAILLVGVIKAILGDLGLSKKQQILAGQVVPARLKELEGNTSGER